MFHIPKLNFYYRDTSPLPNVYIDMDDVIVDFSRYFCHRFLTEVYNHRFVPEDFTAYGYMKDLRLRTFMHSRLRNLGVDYWSRMPYTQFGKYLWLSLKGHRPFVFYNTFEQDIGMDIGKFKLAKRHLNFRYLNRYMSYRAEPMYSDFYRLLINKDKTKYARKENGVKNILIDDSVHSCDAWEEAGGIAYLYSDNIMIVDRIINEVHNKVNSEVNLGFLLEWDQKRQRHIH